MNTKDIYHNSMHMYWLDCDSCHPKIFPQTKGGTKNLSMKNIFAGEFCGKCHGKVAFSLSYCERCHITEQPAILSKPDKDFPIDNSGMINWVGAYNAGMFIPFDTINGSKLNEPEDQVEIGFIEGFQGGSNRTGMGNAGGGIGGTLVFFPHKLHSFRLTCDSCHPDPFPKKIGGTKNMGMANIAKGKYCGKCHGKVAFAIENCIRCHPKVKKNS
jgi:c(7)-type cytochrome triheme protein